MLMEESSSVYTATMLTVLKYFLKNCFLFFMYTITGLLVPKDSIMWGSPRVYYIIISILMLQIIDKDHNN